MKDLLGMKLKVIAAGVVFLMVSSFFIGGGIAQNRKGDAISTPVSNYENSDKIFEKSIIMLMRMAHMSALSAAIVKGDKLVWAKGFGLYDRENGKEADEKTIYLVASISKTFTSTALMQLHERGYFDLDDDVDEYLPFSLRNPNFPDVPITFRMLLAHQSSLAEDPPGFYAYIPGDPEVEGYPYPWLEEYLLPGGINYIPQIWTDLPPGSEMNYANVGYGLLGYLVEIISGKSFEEYCRENIFEPLGMENTSFRLANVDAGRVAVPYVFRNGYQPLLHYGILVYPAGGLRTTVTDLSRFLIANMNGGVYNGTRIASEESINEMHTVQYPGRNYNFQYGLGWQIWKTSGDTYIGHTGGLYGVATKMVFRKSDNTGVIFFTNKEVSNIREVIAFSLIERMLFWKADGFKLSELREPAIEETVFSNKNLLDDSISRNEIVRELPEFDYILSGLNSR